eukprot:scaffold96719_cov28-Tisochrysis_lutea.AAC.3
MRVVRWECCRKKVEDARLRRRVCTVVEAIGADGNVFCERVVLPQKLLDHVRQPGGNNEYGNVECCQAGEKLQSARSWHHLCLSHHAWNEMTWRLAMLDHELMRPVPPTDAVGE